MFTDRHRTIWMVIIVLGAVGVLVPLANSYVRLLATQALIFGILAMSVDLLLGFTGLPSLGQAAYLGVGAYLTAILADRFQFGLGCDLVLVMVLGMLLGAATAAVFGLFAIRATGVYFLIITLALGMVVWGVVLRWNSVTNGDNGINVLYRPVCGVNLSEGDSFFYFSLAVFSACLAALHLLVKSPFGRSLVGIRESEARMRMLGYNTWLHKYIAFVIAGAFGGLAGVLWTHLNGIVSPEDVVLTTSVDALLMAVLGGAGTLVGPALGAGVVVLLREYLSTLVEWWQYVLGGVYILTIIYLPDGLMGLPARIRQWRMATHSTQAAEPVSAEKRDSLAQPDGKA